ncbi:MAG: Ribosomal protein N(5)-glutamine methyltransferase [Betaproteobacteria bacterium]|nr:Ribosomal protein N(5)-glutamine methyltransferase [Betaproteobacteria bacterium]
MSRISTTRNVIDQARSRLARAHLAYGHGIPSAWDEAVYLVLHALKLPPGRLNAALERIVPPQALARVSRLVDERIKRRVPAAYLTHEAWLGDYRFYVDERVIVPRSYIAELIGERFSPWLAPRQRIARALDLCTGSGCLAIVLAKTFTRAAVDAVDLDSGALAVARRNVAAYRLQRRVRLLRSDMFEAVRNARYDLIIANPPYVSAAAMRALPPEYRHEPEISLASGKDGLDAVRVILREAAAHLTDRGVLVVEVGHHRRRVERAFPRYAFTWPQTSGGDDCVFMLDRAELQRAAALPGRTAQPAEPAAPAAPVRRRASRAGGASRRR